LPIAILVPIRIRIENPQIFSPWESPYDSAKRENALGYFDHGTGMRPYFPIRSITFFHLSCS
jgi:hypothetical protein